jgi:phosphoribosylanthranilate isomerase
MVGDVKVQIYTMQTVAEAAAVAALGVDHVGVTPANRGLPGEVGLVVGHDICEAVSGLATSVALSVDIEVGAIENMVHAVRPDILHLCGPPGAVTPEAVADLRRALPGVAVMQAIAVTGSESVAVACSYAAVSDYLILDSSTPDVPGIGAAGTVHDWEVSAAIVAEVDVPVVLAGGLSPDNVAAAIETVGPWGVDSLTHTNRVLDTGGFRKDLGLVGRFVSAVRGTVAS